MRGVKALDEDAGNAQAFLDDAGQSVLFASFDPRVQVCAHLLRWALRSDPKLLSTAAATRGPLSAWVAAAAVSAEDARPLPSRPPAPDAWST